MHAKVDDVVRQQIARLQAQGLSGNVIASQLNLSRSTVQRYLAVLQAKQDSPQATTLLAEIGKAMVSRDTLLSLIDPDPEQPRKVFDEVALAELSVSIAANGLAVPILLRPAPDGRFIIVHGERRWRAAQRLGWQTIPAEVRELSPDAAHWLSLVENVQRADLSPIEEARAYQARLAQGLTQTQLARRMGKDRSYIAQKLRLLTLPPPVQTYLASGALREGHARQLLKLRQWLGAEMRVRLDPAIRFVSGEVHAPVDAAFNAWGEAISANGMTVPGWELAAFWWADQAAQQRQSVAQLAAALEDWHLSVCVAACFIDSVRRAGWRGDRPREFTVEGVLWDEIIRLLAQLGWLLPILKGQLPEALRRQAYDRVQAYQPAQQD